MEPAPPETSGAAQVLVVEDSRAQRALLCAILVNDGHVVTEARDGHEGEALARGRRFDLIVTDYEMPGQNGMELTRRLRALAEYRSVPILIMSARSDLDSRVNGLSTGAHDYLVKPLAQREVEARVRSLLQLGRSQRALEQRNLQLGKALDELQRCQSRLVAAEKLAYAGRLASGIMHECNSPLQALGMTLSAIQMSSDDLVAALPPDARASSWMTEICAEMPKLFASCMRMVERLTDAVGRFRALEGVSSVQSVEHSGDLRRTVERAIELAGRGRCLQVFPAEVVPVKLPHAELERHLATLLGHICAAHGDRHPIGVRVIAAPASPRIEISAHVELDVAGLLGSDFDDSQGRVQFDMSVSSAREALLRMGAGIETLAGADHTATLVIAFRLAAPEAR